MAKDPLIGFVTLENAVGLKELLIIPRDVWPTHNRNPPETSSIPYDILAVKARRNVFISMIIVTS